MIFITLGSQKFQFNRILMEIDRLLELGKINDEVFAQIGYSDYKPQNYKYKNFLDRIEFISNINKSNIIITHGGTGAIVNAIKNGKKVIAVPRLKKFDEHVDDHQLQITAQFKESMLIESITDIKDLENALKKIDTISFEKYVSNTDKVIQSIDEFIKLQQ